MIRSDYRKGLQISTSEYVVLGIWLSMCEWPLLEYGVRGNDHIHPEPGSS